MKMIISESDREMKDEKTAVDEKVAYMRMW